MRKTHTFLFMTILLLTMSFSAHAQFDPKNNARNRETRMDTLKVEANDKSEMLKFKIYNDAYDTYLRDMQSRHRNQFETKAGLTFSQTSFSNWAAGGMSSFAGRTYANVNHKYTAPKFNVTSVFDAALGVISSDGKFRKSEDYFNISSSPSWKLAPRWELSASLLLRSQFTNTYTVKKDASGVEYSEFSSTFFAPAYLTIAPGIKYTNKPNTLELFFAPTSGNLIMVLNHKIASQGSFSGQAGRKFTPQFINYFRAQYKEKIYKEKLSIDVKLESFWRYDHGTPRLIAEAKVEYKIFKFLMANLYMMGIYDDTIKTPYANNPFQLNETFGIGLAYNFISIKHPAPTESPRKGYKRQHKIRL